MLAGVLLDVIEAAFPIDAAVDSDRRELRDR